MSGLEEVALEPEGEPHVDNVAPRVGLIDAADQGTVDTDHHSLSNISTVDNIPLGGTANQYMMVHDASGSRKIRWLARPGAAVHQFDDKTITDAEKIALEWRLEDEDADDSVGKSHLWRLEEVVDGTRGEARFKAFAFVLPGAGTASDLAWP